MSLITNISPTGGVQVDLLFDGGFKTHPSSNYYFIYKPASTTDLAAALTNGGYTHILSVIHDNTGGSTIGSLLTFTEDLIRIKDIYNSFTLLTGTNSTEISATGIGWDSSRIPGPNVIYTQSANMSNQKLAIYGVKI